MNRERAIIVVSILVSVLSLGGSHLLSGILRAERERLQLTVSIDALENLPPEIAFTTTALGSFRGLAVDYLWFRANALQQEGKYYEAIQLSDWITKLQPRFPRVWAFQAWNLSYNLSAAVTGMDEKWMWVDEGIRLLRDKAIPMNPKEVMLYRELAYILFHKIGKMSIEEHWYFKRQFADEWEGVLGAPVSGSSKEAVAFMQAVVDAPDSLDDLLKEVPELRGFVERFQGRGMALDAEWLRQVHLIQARIRWSGINAPETDDEKLSPAMRIYLWLSEAEKDPKVAVARNKLLSYLRKRVLTRDYHMDPEFMVSLMERLGPMDFRHPAAHTVYWAAKGTWQSERNISEDAFVVLQADRMLLQGLRTLAFSGRIHYDPITRYYHQTPDPRMFGSFEVALKEAVRRQEKLGKDAKALASSHRSFLEWVTREAYLYGSTKYAAAYYKKLRDEYEDQYPGDYTKTLERFVDDMLARGNKQLEQVRSAIDSLLRRAFAEGFALKRDRVGQIFVNRAEKMFKKYEILNRISKGAGDSNKLKLPSFRTLVVSAFFNFLSAPGITIHPAIKGRVWNGAPVDLRRDVYDRLKIKLHKEAKAVGLDPQKVFPEPSEMDAYRRNRANAAKKILKE